MRKSVIVALIIGAAIGWPAAQLGAATLNVPGDYPTIQQALDAATYGDEVLVAPGTYGENLIVTVDGVSLRSVGGASVTTIDGGQSGPVIQFSDVGSTARLEGFTVTNGRTVSVGGGLLLVDASPMISLNVLTGNQAQAGGAMYLTHSSPTIIDNEVRNNDAPYGSGGGIYCDNGSSPIIERNIIAHNTSAAYGGGVTIWVDSMPTLVQNTIVFNEALLGGGGVYVTRGAAPNLERNIVGFSPVGGGVEVAGDATATLGCNDVYGNAPTNYAGLPDPSGTGGNISTDPLFCDPTTLEIAGASDCAPNNSPGGCELIGARTIGCVPTPIASGSWGDLKVRYRVQRERQGETVSAGR